MLYLEANEVVGEPDYTCGDEYPTEDGPRVWTFVHRASHAE
jgi:hypothetical protein